MRYSTICIVSLLMALLCGCESDAPEVEPALVLEGWIDSDGYPCVVLTTSVTPSQEEWGSLTDNMIRWGKVTISDGEQTFVLTGAPENDFFPPYVYRTFRMMGEPGKCYTIEAVYKEMKCRASSVMPAPTPIDDITVAPANSDASLYSATLHLTSPGEGYYRIFTRVSPGDTRFYPSFLGTFATGATGQKVSQPICRGKHDTDTADFVPQFRPGESVEVMLCHIDRAAYDFWQDFDNTVSFGGSMFVGAPEGLRSNIEGGYGIWSARGTTIRQFCVGPEPLP